MRSLVAAAHALNLAQVLLVSSAACTQREHIHNLWGDILLWKERSEQWLRSSGVPYTVLRPTGLRAYAGVDSAASVSCRVTGLPSARRSAGQMSRAWCVGLLSDPASLGKTFEAYNDDSLPPGSWVGTFGQLARDA